MKILFTGSSAFTGYWFIHSLVEQGHQVVATFQRLRSDYADVRAERVSRLTKLCETHFNTPMPSLQFQTLIKANGSWDLWCHHAADVTNYKSSDFDPIKALQNNCADLSTTLKSLQDRGCQRVLLTGSVFEQREGAEFGSACSAYGLSKGLTADVFAYYLMQQNMHFGKFVIPNPFGPFEEQRLTHFLVDHWSRGNVPTIQHPSYIRDNIHVTLLAKAYATYAGQLSASPGSSVLRPSGYRGTQQEFVNRFAQEIGKRLSLNTPVTFAPQADFSEPLSRVNNDALDHQALHWNETQAWDDLASYYDRIVLKNT